MIPLPIEDALYVMSLHRDQLEEALRRGGDLFALADIAELVVTSRVQVWAVDASAVAITEIQTYPRGRVINLWLVAGSMPPILQMQEPIAAWARSHGCILATMDGRHGWSRILTRAGWIAASTRLALHL